MLRVERDWPDFDLLAWVQADSDFKRALWIVEHGYWWHVWDGDRFAGYVAAVPLGKNRWSFHFGAVAGIDHARIMVRAWRIFLKIAQANSVRLLVAYISHDRPDILRLAKIFHFKRFRKLWALLPLLPTSSRHRGQLPRSRWKTKT
jgi:hypothetical protein